MPYSMQGRAARDPRESAPPGTYLTDGQRLVEVIEADWQRALAEDMGSGNLVEIDRVDLMQQWRVVTPAAVL